MANKALYDRMRTIFTKANQEGSHIRHFTEETHNIVQWSVHQIITPFSGGMYYRNELETNSMYEIFSPDEFVSSCTKHIYYLMTSRRNLERPFKEKKEKKAYETPTRTDHPTRGIQLKGSKAERQAALRSAQRDKE